jgi:G6PDH family F420-dependent oxidoreductase
MTTFGFKLMCELHGPRALVEQAVAAEGRGYDFVAISDHFHPWLPEHEHSPFAWSVLGAIADRTTTIHLATGLTCPVGRYEPAIVAQAAATVATMAGGRFTLAVGSGERLNEHVTGREFPSVSIRQDRLREAIEAMQALWSGGFTSYHGTHVVVDDARIYDLPPVPIELVVGVSGDASLDLAAQVHADGIMATDADAALVDGWAQRGGDRSATWTEVAFGWAPTEDEGRDLVWDRMRFGAPGWKVMAELPNPVNFAAATEHLDRSAVVDQIPHGPDPEPYVEAIRSYVDAGFERLAILPVGDDVAGTLDFFEQQVRPALA